MDQALLFKINHDWTAPALDWVMAIASSFDFWTPFLILLGLIVLIRGGFRARACLLCLGLCIGATDGIVVHVTKSLVGRPRPNQSLEHVRILDLARAKPRFLALGKPLKEEYSVVKAPPKRGNSFPSGHTANNFAIAAVLAVFYRRWGWLYLLPASLVGYSRVYVGSHWPSDVIASALLGAGLSLLVLWLAGRIWRQWGGRFLPALHARHPTLF